jgi:hypothetical protein
MKRRLEPAHGAIVRANYKGKRLNLYVPQKGEETW